MENSVVQLKKFETLKEAREYGQSGNLRTQVPGSIPGVRAIRAEIKGSCPYEIILCETFKDVEDDLWADAQALAKKFYDRFELTLCEPFKEDCAISLASSIRDLVIRQFEIDANATFYAAFTNY